jgi:tRNA dimethylallyltransferase
LENKYLISISGATAIGKTALSIALAKAFDCEIISCDSRQFFKEMKIGTAVPEHEELAQAKHHFIQHISIFDDYSVGKFETDALAKLNALFQHKNYVIMVGGSGLYERAVIEGLDYFPNVDKSIRETLNILLETQGIAALQKELKEVDLETFNKMDIANPHRLVRALEIYRGTGKTYSSFLNKPKATRPFKTIKIGLEAARPLLYERINKRVDIMMENGLLEEAKTLYPHKAVNALQTVGYSELFAYFDGEFTLDFAISEIKKNTRRFAKRQGTWYRKDESIKRFDFKTDYQEIIDFVKHTL